jgi:hypothetical protein
MEDMELMEDITVDCITLRAMETLEGWQII